MPNVLVVPVSGAIFFDRNVAGASTVAALNSAVRLNYDNGGGLNITSYATALTALDRFTVDGAQGRLFSVTDALTGSLMSVNDITGLPILEVLDTDTVIAGSYNTNTFIISGTRIAIGRTIDSTAKVAISGNTTVSGILSTNNIIFGGGLNVQGAANVQGSLSITPASGTQTFSNYFSVVSSNPATTLTVFAVTNTNRVGIGTDAPDQKLHVLKASAGTVTADTNSIAVFEGGSNNHITILTPDGQTGGVVFGSPSDNFGSYLTWNYDNNALKLGTDKTGGFISLLTDDEAEAVRITSTGKVGIGTIVPAEKLTVSGNVSATGVIYSSGGNSNQWNSNYTTTNANSGLWSGAYTSFNANSSFYDAAVNELFTYVITESGDEFITEDSLLMVDSNIDGYPAWNSTTETVVNLSANWGRSSVTTSLSFGSISARGYTDQYITLHGASVGDAVFVTCTSVNRTTDPYDVNLFFDCLVSSANIITIRAHNPTDNLINNTFPYDYRVILFK